MSKWFFCLLASINCYISAYSDDNLNRQFYSQASQDQFVHLLLYKALDKQDCGYYLEIGAAEPVNINNTYFFEKDYGWKGISIEIDSSHTEKWNSIRKNPLLIADATKVNYEEILSQFPKIIDYLSLDIDEQYDTVLKRIPFQSHIFKVITIEHDHWRYGDTYRQREREILTSLGYVLLCSDVWLHSQASFEDWWIYPDFFPKHILSKLQSLDLRMKKHSELLSLLKSIHLE